MNIAPPKPMSILILGGTGFTGPHQVRYALSRGHKVTLFNRGRRPNEWPAAVEELTGDRETNDYASLKNRKFDVCIDNATSVPHWIRDVAAVLKGHVRSTYGVRAHMGSGLLLSYFLNIKNNINIKCDNERPDPCLRYMATNATDKSRQSAYRDLFRAALDDAAIDDTRLALNQNQPLGNTKFYNQIEKRLGERREARPRGRPLVQKSPTETELPRRFVL